VVDTLLLTEWLDKLRKVEGHVASLEMAHARPTLLPSMGSSRESLIRCQRTLALLNDLAEVMAHRMMMLDPSSTLWGFRIRESQEACFHLHKVGAQVRNPLQCYRSAEEGTTALQAALAVVEHNRPGFESHRQQPHWPRLTAQDHEAALLQLNALAVSLRNPVDKLNLGADSRVTRLPALIRRLYNKCCRDPLEKDAHRSWWETMVTLCRAALRKGKSWPESHDRAINKVADSWEHIIPGKDGLLTTPPRLGTPSILFLLKRAFRISGIQNHNEYVVFDRLQVYPKFIVRYAV